MTANRPPNNIEFAKQLAKRLYSIDTNVIKELNSYNDRNYHLITNQSSKEFILKITNKVEAKHKDEIDAINAFILHLHNKGFKVTVPVINTNGDYISYEDIPTDGELDQINGQKPYAVRLMEFIPGKPLRYVPFTPSLLTECGLMLAKMTIALKDFEAPALKSRKFPYGVLRALNIRKYLIDVQEVDKRQLINECLDQFNESVLSIVHELRHTYIHDDYNEFNIIVGKDSEHRDDEYHMTGLIDFGDVEYGPRVFDLAVYLAHSMLWFTAGPQILAPGFGIKGYTQLIEMDSNELDVLYYSIKARLCQSLVNGVHTIRLDPSNTYVFSSQETGWSALRALHECQPKDLIKKCLKILEYNLEL
ncbi:hydroxylysine kinase-like [Oppia nitens]|uniref:hydroxylysine kinase-like n=1 Tax=Oppia nitens TaxID=1686743 RepID=UPI0023D9D72D|nr:hydroxylysine kinase-like [Oppia nitens]